MILFLDFDGVLHPQPFDDGDEFCLRPLFERMVRNFDDLQIVISSSWRHQESLSTIRSRFSKEVAAMIIGQTPDHMALPAEVAPHLSGYSRQREIVAWCDENGVAPDAWIAVDDEGDLFEPDSAQVVICDPKWGLTEPIVDHLRALISAKLGAGRYLAP